MIARLLRASRSTACGALVLALAAGSAAAAPLLSRLSLNVSPELSLPLTEGESLGPGGGSGLGARLPLDLLRSERLTFLAGPDARFIYQGNDLNGEDLSILSLGAGFGPSLRFSERLSLEAEAEGGAYSARIPSGARGSSLYFGAGLGAGFSPSPAFTLRLSAAWRDYAGLYQAAALGLGASLRLDKLGSRRDDPPGLRLLKASSPASRLSFSRSELSPLFPILFKYYDDHPVGSASLRNGFPLPVEHVTVSYYVNQYMDNPKVCASFDRIEPGAEVPIELSALFNDRLLEVSEGTKVSARLVAEYVVGGAPGSEELSQAVRVFDRNASMWDDDRKAAAFVTSKDQTVLRFAKNVLAMVRDEANPAVNQKLLAAMAFHEATRVYGLTYVVDPSNSYAAVLDDATVVDYLQFPRQTLDYKAGNCSALSILYCALLESVGVETAFITVPGHILMAVDLGMGPEEARASFALPEDLVLAGGRAWLPLETTARDSGFVEAWKRGAKQWRESSAKGLAALYPVHEAWALYEPVGFSAELGDLELPGRERLRAAYAKELSGYVDAELYTQAASLNEEIRASGRSPRAINKLGVLFARYGRYEQARAAFDEAAKGQYAPALVNQGHLRLRAGELKQALARYEAARELAPWMPEVYLALARVNRELEDYEAADAAFAKLQALSPGLAARNSHLALKGEAGQRAAEASGSDGQFAWSLE